MATETTTVAAPAAAPATSPASTGNSTGPRGVDRVEGPLKADLGDEFDVALPNPDAASTPGSTKVTGQPGPALPGQPSAPAPTPDAQPGAQAPVDEVQAALDYYAKLSPADQADADAAAVAAGTKGKTETSTGPVPITTVLAEKQQAIAAALKGAGLNDQQIAELTNAPTLAGRHGAEIGQLRKDNQQFVQMAQMLQPVLEFDPATKVPKGFNGVRLLELATQQFGPEEVQRQLADVRLKIVPLDWQQAQPSANGDFAKVRQATLMTVAKEFGIETEGLTPEEVRAGIEANWEAKDAFADRLSDYRAKANLQADVRVRQTEAQRQAQDRATREAQEQEAGQVLAEIQKLTKEVPHFQELEPVMADLYVKHFKAGPPSKVAITDLLRYAAEGLTIGKRLPKLLASYKTQVERAFAKRIGLPESEVIDAAPSSQPRSTNAILDKGYVPEFDRP